MSWNSRSKYVKKTKSDVDLAILHVILSILQFDIFVHVILQIESKANSLLYSKYVVVLAPLIYCYLFL